MILRLIETSEAPKVGDLMQQSNTREIFIYEGLYREGDKVVKPYGVSDEEIKVGDMYYSGISKKICKATHLKVDAWRSSSAEEGIRAMSHKVEILPEQFNYQQLVELQLKDGDGFHAVDMPNNKVSLYFGHPNDYVIPQRQEINDGHYIELLDRLHIVCSMIDDHLVSHPVCEANPEIEECIVRGQALLSQAYQLAGKLK